MKGTPSQETTHDWHSCSFGEIWLSHAAALLHIFDPSIESHGYPSNYSPRLDQEAMILIKDNEHRVQSITMARDIEVDRGPQLINRSQMSAAKNM
jgi:hypothetical protein